MEIFCLAVISGISGFGVRMRKLIVLAITFYIILTKGVFAQDTFITGTVSDKFGNLPGARIAVEGTTISTSSDVNGKFVLEIDPGEYTIKASFVLYLTQEQQVFASSGDSINIDFVLESTFSIDEEAFVGSRSRPRSLLETTVPIDIIAQDRMSNSPQVELGQILHYSAPSFNSTRQTIADGTDHIDPATLRGLGPDQVLVLINGKRRHSSSLLNVNGTLGRGSVGTDFNAIPFGAVDRIEILRDGAAAQYGSDAIAGVVNIVLKEQTGVTEIDAQVGTNTEGDGETAYFNGNVGFDIGDGGFVNFTAEYRDREATNRSGNYTGPVYFNNNPAQDLALIQSRDFFRQTGFDDQRVMEIGNSAARNVSFFVNAEFPLSRVISLYAHGGRNFRNSEAAGFYRFPRDSSQVVQSLYPDGFSPRIRTDIQDDAITIGVRGLKNGWNLDFSNTTGMNEFDFNVLNSNNASLGDASPTEFFSGGFIYRQNVTNFNVSRTLNWLQGVNLAFGAEFRIENYEILAGEEASWINGQDTLFTENGAIARVPGAQVFPGFQPENELDEFRTNNAWYLDMESKLNDKLLVGAAARYETYSDFGDQATWKLSGRYELTDEISVSAGVASGFRAPSLHQVFFSNISIQFVDNEALRVGTFNNESTVAAAFGIDELKPEISRHISAGVVARPMKNLSITLDYYTIFIDDRIVLSGRFEEGNEDILAPLNVGAAQFFTNAIDTRTIGIDLVATYRESIGRGEFFTSLAGNFTNTKLDGPIQTSDALAGDEDILFNREEVSRIEVIQPNFKVISQSSYKLGKLSANLNHTLFGRVRFIDPNDGDPSNWPLNTLTGAIESRDQTFNPKIVTDLILSWQFNSNFRASIGGHNIFNIYPDEHTHSENTSLGRFRFSRRAQQFGVAGARVFLKASLTL
ncbi:MAG: TonB-dependent receptor [Bacteroidota bacterium]